MGSVDWQTSFQSPGDRLLSFTCSGVGTRHALSSTSKHRGRVGAGPRWTPPAHGQHMVPAATAKIKGPGPRTGIETPPSAVAGSPSSFLSGYQPGGNSLLLPHLTSVHSLTLFLAESLLFVEDAWPKQARIPRNHH